MKKIMILFLFGVLLLFSGCLDLKNRIDRYNEAIDRKEAEAFDKKGAEIRVREQAFIDREIEFLKGGSDLALIQRGSELDQTMYIIGKIKDLRIVEENCFKFDILDNFQLSYKRSYTNSFSVPEEYCVLNNSIVKINFDNLRNSEINITVRNSVLISVQDIEVQNIDLIYEKMLFVGVRPDWNVIYPNLNMKVIQ